MKFLGVEFNEDITWEKRFDHNAVFIMPFARSPQARENDFYFT
jgi:hypothetical protein